LTRFSYEAGPTRIVRTDRVRSVTVEADVVGRTVGEAFQEIRAGLEELSVPFGYAVKYEGDVEAMRETFTDMGMAFGLAVAITFLMVAAILESWSFAFIIILTVPLSAIGVIPAMVATNTAVSLYALMGLVMLVGLVVNNAIVIVDYAEGLRRGGSAAAEAIIEEELRNHEAWISSLEVVPTIVEFREKIEGIMKSELEKSASWRQALSETDQSHVEGLVASIVNKILHEPTACLREESRNRNGLAYAAALRRLFKLEK